MESKSGMEAVAQETIIGNSLGKVYFTAFFKSLFLDMKRIVDVIVFSTGRYVSQCKLDFDQQNMDNSKPGHAISPTCWQSIYFRT